MSFDQLGLKQDIINHLASLKFNEPTQVQSTVIPVALQGKNVVFTSRTGSGKTLAYLLGFLSKLNKKFGVQMMVLVPTRELAIQVGKEIKKVIEPLGFNVGVLYGGRDISGDYKTLVRKNQIMVGTPGRLIQHINEKHLKVGETKYVVFDESDQMFDQGFYQDCTYVLERISKDAQIILSSATITSKVQSFMSSKMGSYELLRIGELIPSTIMQKKKYCKMNEKNALLLDFLTNHKFKRCIIFCNTKMKTNDIKDHLVRNGFNARSINSNLEQQDRTNYLNLFKEGKVNVLVATDVAARGLHIENVDIVINYDAPSREEFYVHRIGRTGRVGSSGYAFNLICEEDVERFSNIEKRYKLDVTEV